MIEVHLAVLVVLGALNLVCFVGIFFTVRQLLDHTTKIRWRLRHMYHASKAKK